MMYINTILNFWHKCRVFQFKDLGIIFDRKLHFSLHTEMIINKAFRNLGFINRTCAAFSDPIPLKILCVSLLSVLI